MGKKMGITALVILICIMFIAPVRKYVTNLFHRQSLVEEKKTPIVLSTYEIQKALKKAGFYNGVVDGRSGPATIAAIKEFQRVQGLKADGIVGSKTRSKIIGLLTK